MFFNLHMRVGVNSNIIGKSELLFIGEKKENFPLFIWDFSLKRFFHSSIFMCLHGNPFYSSSFLHSFPLNLMEISWKFLNWDVIAGLLEFSYGSCLKYWDLEYWLFRFKCTEKMGGFESFKKFDSGFARNCRFSNFFFKKLRYFFYWKSLGNSKYTKKTQIKIT